MAPDELISSTSEGRGQAAPRVTHQPRAGTATLSRRRHAVRTCSRDTERGLRVAVSGVASLTSAASFPPPARFFPRRARPSVVVSAFRLRRFAAPADKKAGRPLQSGYTERMAQQTAPSITVPPDPVIEAYKKDIDRGLLRNNLRRTVEERLLELMRMQRFVDELQRKPRAS